MFNTPGANANAVKELVLAALFLAARNIVPAAAFAHRLDGDAGVHGQGRRVAARRTSSASNCPAAPSA